MSPRRTFDLLESLGAEAWDAVYHEAGDEALTRREFTAPLRRLLEDGAADGTLEPGGDLEETATVLYNQVGWTYRHLTHWPPLAAAARRGRRRPAGARRRPGL